jgi:hypothetical protein
MQLSLHRHHKRASSLLRPAPPAPTRASRAQARAQRSGGPLDRALYSCSCGAAFKADVSTTVGCPHCGQTQAW